MSDIYRESVAGTGRDAGKMFHVSEAPPLDMAAFMLRLASALRVPSYEDLIGQLLSLKTALPSAAATTEKRGKRRDDEVDTGVALNVIMQLLQRCDADALRGLIQEALSYVTITPDPKHPGAERALMGDDIREKATLVAILVAFAKLNAWDGA